MSFSESDSAGTRWIFLLAGEGLFRRLLRVAPAQERQIRASQFGSYSTAFGLPDVNHTFQKGHRLMIQIQSTWFPLMDRNPQKFCNIHTATESDFQKATQRIYRSNQLCSQLKVTVLK